MANEKRLIDADALLEELTNDRDQDCNRYMYWGEKINRDAKYDFAIERIQDAPTVDAVPVVHGQWLDGCAVHNGKRVYDSIDCSNCEEVFKIESNDREYWKKRFNVCPFCGAVMDGGNEDG